MTSGTRLIAALAIVVLAGCGSTGSRPPPEPHPFDCSSELASMSPLDAGGQIAPLCGATPYPSGTTPPADSAPPPASTPPAATPSSAPGPAALPLLVSDPGHVTGSLARRTCHVLGMPPDQRPDPACTPGAYDPKITAAILCAPRYTTRVYRPAAAETTRFKYDQAYPAYASPLPSSAHHGGIWAASGTSWAILTLRRLPCASPRRW